MLILYSLFFRNGKRNRKALVQSFSPDYHDPIPSTSSSSSPLRSPRGFLRVWGRRGMPRLQVTSDELIRGAAAEVRTPRGKSSARRGRRSRGWAPAPPAISTVKTDPCQDSVLDSDSDIEILFEQT